MKDSHKVNYYELKYTSLGEICGSLKRAHRFLTEEYDNLPWSFGDNAHSLITPEALEVVINGDILPLDSVKGDPTLSKQLRKILERLQELDIECYIDLEY